MDGETGIVAFRLQCCESSLMIDALGNRLMRLDPDEAVGKIHDALVCKSCFAERAKAHVKAVFAQIGLNPGLELVLREVIDIAW